MSLIQQALEKTSRVQETNTEKFAPSPKTYDRDPMGAALEQELTQLQQSYARRRKLYWIISMGVLFVCFFAGLSYLGTRTSSLKAKTLPKVGPVSVQETVKISSEPLYRLTGITNMNGHAMAVINNEIVSVGDSLLGKATVKTIADGEVRLDVQGNEIKLTL